MSSCRRGVIDDTSECRPEPTSSPVAGCPKATTQLYRVGQTGPVQGLRSTGPVHRLGSPSEGTSGCQRRLRKYGSRFTVVFERGPNLWRSEPVLRSTACLVPATDEKGGGGRSTAEIWSEDERPIVPAAVSWAGASCCVRAVQPGLKGRQREERLTTDRVDHCPGLEQARRIN
ncbi:feruloyl coa ortho-hydroxylase 2 [Phtheirospermum japonicum]|uniref:Feruloyl coa ortho-hydroxylase 2 n=1 Tax=Phtheirospermum japonicum TaxID=374723 RepID=A0A830D294_9LAMI|nr:feruloyl coa ortho-hydroxylase 2 [Phtheirospermum japonicum]